MAGVAAQFAQQSQQARAQRKVSRINRENAQSAFQNQITQIDTRTAQQAAAAGQAITRVRKEAIAARSKAQASAAESGVKGATVDALVNDFTRQEGEFVAATLLNEKFQQEAAQLEKRGARLGLSGALAGNLDVPGPDAVIAALQAGAAGLGAYNSAAAAKK